MPLVFIQWNEFTDSWLCALHQSPSHMLGTLLTHPKPSTSSVIPNPSYWVRLLCPFRLVYYHGICACAVCMTGSWEMLSQHVTKNNAHLDPLKYVGWKTQIHDPTDVPHSNYFNVCLGFLKFRWLTFIFLPSRCSIMNMQDFGKILEQCYSTLLFQKSVYFCGLAICRGDGWHTIPLRGLLFSLNL